MSPKVSVLMPNYNCEKYLSQAIDSILHQSFTDFEFIIIDDCSTDNSWEIIQKYANQDARIIALKNDENLKICKTLNKGLKIARGQYIARMDSDDISNSERLEKQVSFLDENINVGIVGAAMEIMNESGEIQSKREYNLNDESIRAKLFRYSPFCHPVIMMRRDILEKSGGYDENLVYSEDYDLYFRIGMHGQFANISDTLIYYRMFEGNSTTKKLKQMERGTICIRKKAVKKYGYKMTLGDNIYNTLQEISTYIIPGKMKIWLFNLIRNS